jgi:hypothetical protein
MTAIVTHAVVSPLRFTDHPAETTALFELLGLRRAVRQGGFEVLQGGGGRLSIHPLETAASTTVPASSLVLDVPDVVVTSRRLDEAGLTATWWDESWGRQATVAAPFGTLWLNAELVDTYGFEVQAPAEPTAGVVVAIVVPDLVAAAEFLAAFGFTPDPGGAPDVLRGGPGAGALRLVQGEGDSSVASIALETPEPLADVAARLEAAGHAVTRTDGGTTLTVTAPDGDAVRITRAAPAAE